MFQAYVITCLSTGKQYIGITTRSDLRQRWKEHVYNASKRPNRSAIYSAIVKYGAANFAIEPVACALSNDAMREMEVLLINQRGTLFPDGYNLTAGGEGRFGFRPTPESVERSAAKHRGKPCHPNTRKAAAETHSGKPKALGHRAKIAASKRGVSRSSETKAKLAAYWKKRRAAGEFKTTGPYEHSRKAPRP